MKQSDMWRSKIFWHRVGYALTSAWFVYVLWKSGADPSHVNFRYIFIVPLAGWILGLAVAAIVRRVWPPDPPPPDQV